MTLSKQEMFNKAYVETVKQGVQCLSEETLECMYLDRPTGNRCAAGHLMKGHIPEDSEAWDYVGSIDELRELGVELPWDKAHDTLVCSIQRCHDKPNAGERWLGTFKLMMRDVATIHGLSVPDVDNAN